MNNYKIDVLAFGANPDDLECATAGVIIKHVALGKTVAIVDITTGEMGTFGTPERRAKEASKILKIKYREQ